MDMQVSTAKTKFKIAWKEDGLSWPLNIAFAQVSIFTKDPWLMCEMPCPGHRMAALQDH